jgi:signal transduction histidine kinase
VNLGRIAEETVESAAPHAQTAGVRLSAEIALGVTVPGDEDRLGQVLDNLISNAIKFTPSGGSVTVRLSASAGWARVEVADDGIGIAADELERVFDAFFRASTATARHVPGVGLGLAVTRSIVQLHGGRISVRSAPGEGATFAVDMPLA